jgi:SpoVK/Ycf46/Vps4 family AAA+-type ATPase
MIDDNNRSLFLNELDGFESNTGPVVLATTNHPDKLDPAILDRPSRFDRKYHFNLPAAAERLAYIAAWNLRLEAELRLSEKAVDEVVQQTENFSFAYMEELCVSVTMQWMSTNLGLQAARLQNGWIAQPSPMPDERRPSTNEPDSFSRRASPAPVTAASMDKIILDRAARLRTQMAALSVSSQSPASPGGISTGAFASVRRILRRVSEPPA